jgi:heat shock protein HslJ
VEERQALYGTMVNDREALRQGELDDGTSLDAAGADTGRYDLVLAPAPPYAITVRLPRVTDEARAWFTARYGPGLVFEQNEYAIGAPPSKEGAPLWGSRFDVVAASDEGVPHPLNGQEFVKFAPPDGQATMAWSGGCNSSGTNVTITADLLDTGTGGGSTGKLCRDSSLMDQDDWLTGVMQTDPHWSIDGDRLTIWNDHTMIELVRSAS